MPVQSNLVSFVAIGWFALLRGAVSADFFRSKRIEVSMGLEEEYRRNTRWLGALFAGALAALVVVIFLLARRGGP